MLHAHTRKLLKYYTENPPPDVDRWSGLWTDILMTNFRSSQGYVLFPQRCLSPDFNTRKFKVNKATSLDPLRLRTVLFADVKSSQQWRAGTTSLPTVELVFKREPDLDDPFEPTVESKVYWVDVVGPHWRYGIQEEEGEPRPLIGWHDVTHDEASCTDLQGLITLVANM